MRGEGDLERRQREILAMIIRQYVSSGVPVGSMAVAEQLPAPLSSATIRSVMARLEELGYLDQPHISAGRVPTDKAYRFYVDRIASSMPLGVKIENYIHESLGAPREPAERLERTPDVSEAPPAPDQMLARLLAKVSHVLSEV